ncbi:MAG: hypothetical protein OHK0046_41330 [Anaerolineae bacterium]
MPSQIFWVNDEKTLIYHLYSGDVTADDYYYVIDNNEAMVRSVNHTVNVILDRRGVISSPSNLSRVMRYANNHIPDNQGIRVVVGAALMTKVMVDAGRMLAPRLVKDVYFAESLEEAHDLIAARTQAATT